MSGSMKHATRCAAYGCGRFAPAPTPTGGVCYLFNDPTPYDVVIPHMCPRCEKRERLRDNRRAVLAENVARSSF